MISLVLTLAACRNTKLWSGDISAAFLQGSKLDRTLILSLPKDGVPVLKPNMYYIVSSTVYGTRDAPRGWWKNLDGALRKKGFHPVPFEPGAYTLLEEEGVLAGLLITHVDDLLWSGGLLIEERMKEICEHYKFGKIECDSFRYCGRNITRDADRVYVKCDILIDRVRPIWLTHEQLRSIIGSLAWLSRVRRPDLAYAVCKMQMSVSSATYEDVKYANSIVALAQKTKEVGLAYPVSAFKLENAMILAIQDASHAADYEASSSGARMAHRSQSGRLLCLADSGFFESKTGYLALIEWHSTVLKRVRRSTLQSEALSLLAGSEEAEHLRFVLHGVRHPHCGEPHWQVQAMDGTLVEWLTDCRSLHDHGNQAGLHIVSDKRLAIDLCWRDRGRSLGDGSLACQWQHEADLDQHRQDAGGSSRKRHETCRIATAHVGGSCGPESDSRAEGQENLRV